MYTLYVIRYITHYMFNVRGTFAKLVRVKNFARSTTQFAQ